MADRKRNGLVLVALIIGASGLGIGTYSFIKLTQHDNSDNNLLALWETITGTGTSFFLNFSDNQVNQSEFFSMTDGNTSIALTNIGWYKFTLTLVLIDLSPIDYYQIAVVKNTVVQEFIFYIDDPQSLFWMVQTTYYMFSDGDDIFKFWCMAFDSFSVTLTQSYNHASLEYVEDI